MHAAVGVSFIFFHFNLSIVTIILSKNFSFVLLMHLKRKCFVWIGATFWLLLIILFKYWEQQGEIGEMFNLSEYQCYEFVIILSWNILKSVSFSIDYINNEDKDTGDTFDLINIYGYVLYFPNLLLGPFITFNRYNEMRYNNITWNAENAISRHFTLLKDFGKAIFWIFFTDFSLHFIYLGNLQHNLNVSFKEGHPKM